MAKRRSSYRKKRTYRKKKTAVRRRTAAKKRTVRREVLRTAETKSAQEYVYGTSLRATTYSSFDSTNIVALGPRSTSLPINQGVGQGSRVGNSIHTKSLTIRGAVIPQPYNATTNPTPRPLICTVYFFYDKTSPLAAPTPLANADLFQNGNGAATFDTDMLDGVAPINTDRYHIFKRRSFKVGWADYAGTGGQPTQQNYANNDFKMTCRFKFNLTKYLPKRIRFNDATSQPTTRPIWMMWLVNSADGNVLTSSTVPAFVQYIQDYRYTDV